MSEHLPSILVTGASGQLGRLVIQELLKTVPAANIAAMLRSKSAGSDLEAHGVRVVEADYDKPATLDAALAGIDRVLLISSNALGARVAQHRNVIDAAARAGVKLIAYTSVLHADTSTLGLAEEHRQTEAALQSAGVPFVVLRNGWYTENYAASIPPALAHGAFLGSAGEGRISSASRADYAAAAAAVLASADDQAGKIYELAGDEAYTLAEFAADVAKQAGKPVVYMNLPEADFKAALIGAGLPGEVAELLANSDAAAARGALFDQGGQLRQLIGRPTTPFTRTVAVALQP